MAEPLRIEVEATPANVPAILQRVIEVDENRRTEQSGKNDGLDRAACS